MTSDPRYVVQASTAELDRALSALELPFAVWAPDGEICIVNRAMATLLGEPVDSLIGRNVIDVARLFGPDARRPLELLGSSGVDAIRSRRDLQREDQASVPVWVWSRAVEIDGGFAGLALVLPMADLRARREGAQLWQRLDDVAIGVAAHDWTVVAVSADIVDLIGFEPSELVGTSLVDIIHPDDRRAGNGPAIEDIACRVRLRHKVGRWTPVSVLWANDAHDPNRRTFAALRAPGPDVPTGADRMAELETRLRRIGAEVQAAGLLDRMAALPDVASVPQMAELSSRQWDILSRLLNGDSTQSIAQALYISQSTVRNHLTAIFRKFGVHSRLELLQRLR